LGQFPAKQGLAGNTPRPITCSGAHAVPAVARIRVFVVRGGAAPRYPPSRPAELGCVVGGLAGVLRTSAPLASTKPLRPLRDRISACLKGLSVARSSSGSEAGCSDASKRAIVKAGRAVSASAGILKKALRSLCCTGETGHLDAWRINGDLEGFEGVDRQNRHKHALFDVLRPQESGLTNKARFLQAGCGRCCLIRSSSVRCIRTFLRAPILPCVGVTVSQANRASLRAAPYPVCAVDANGS